MLFIGKKPEQFFAERLLTDFVLGGFDAHNFLQSMISISHTPTANMSHVATI